MATLRPWFQAGHLSLSAESRIPVTVVARDDALGLIIYEQLPIQISVEEGLRGIRTRYREGKLSDFEPWQA